MLGLSAPCSKSVTLPANFDSKANIIQENSKKVAIFLFE